MNAWLFMTSWIWALGAGLSASALAAAALRWRSVPVCETRNPWLRWLGTLVSIAAALALVLALYL
jgi:hypothetical protein